MRRTLILWLLVVGAPLMAPARTALSVPGRRERVRRDDGRDAVAGSIRWNGGRAADPGVRRRGRCQGSREAIRRADAGRAARAVDAVLLVDDRPAGQVFGDPAVRSIARVTNGLRFSYPGYNELLAGFADPRIDSNDPKPNPNVTVLEWLNRRPGFEGRVAAFASWEILPWILNASAERHCLQRRGCAGGDAHDRPRASAERVRRRPSSVLGSDAVRRADRLRRARISAHASAARSLRDARRDRRVGARPALRPVSRRRTSATIDSSGGCGRRRRRCRSTRTRRR